MDTFQLVVPRVNLHRDLGHWPRGDPPLVLEGQEN